MDGKNMSKICLRERTQSAMLMVTGRKNVERSKFSITKLGKIADFTKSLNQGPCYTKDPTQTLLVFRELETQTLSLNVEGLLLSEGG